MNEPQTTLVQSEFQDAVAALRALSHDYDKAFRLGVGQYILQRFFGGSAALFSSRDPTKERSFKAFTEAHADDLAELDLSAQTLQRCVRVRICYDGLPPSSRERLGWSAMLHISALDDGNQRARLATAAVTEQWTVAKVKAAVDLAKQHRLWDAEPESDGLQLPAPKDAPPPQPGRLVTRTEKWAQEIGSWRQEFQKVDAKKLDKAQRERLRAALAAARAELDAVEAGLRG